MSRKGIPQSPHNVLNLPFHSIRHISSPEDLENGRKVYVGQVPIQGIVELPANENVRDYLLDAEGKKRRTYTFVHKDIMDTLENYSHNFSVLNSGVAIVAQSCEIDEKGKRLVLRRPSIINGAQTQGVIRDFLEKRNGNIEPIHIKIEVIVAEDDNLVADISIARNNQNDVKLVSIVGRRGQFDELEKSLQKKMPNVKLQKSETKVSDSYIRTERLLQVIAALVPEQLWVKDGEFNKVYTYSQRAKCLRDFQEIYEKAHKKKHPEHNKYRKLYQFYLDIAAEAYELYEKWKTHQGFQGTGLRCLTRDGREIEDVPDGLVFPILASLSLFAHKTKNGWTITYPELFQDKDLIDVTKRAYMEIAKHNYNKMGKTKACYSALSGKTGDYKKFQDYITEMKRTS